jgi:hypothetical protein
MAATATAVVAAERLRAMMGGRGVACMVCVVLERVSYFFVQHRGDGTDIPTTPHRNCIFFPQVHNFWFLCQTVRTCLVSDTCSTQSSCNRTEPNAAGVSVGQTHTASVTHTNHMQTRPHKLEHTRLSTRHTLDLVGPEST